jgi:hypothetical protein
MRWSSDQEVVGGTKRLLKTPRVRRTLTDIDGQRWVVALRQNEARFTNAWLKKVRADSYPHLTIVEMLRFTGAISWSEKK